MRVNHPFIAPLTCKDYPIAILLHDFCAIYARPPTPLCYATHHTILVMAISCKGQSGGLVYLLLVSSLFFTLSRFNFASSWPSATRFTSVNIKVRWSLSVFCLHCSLFYFRPPSAGLASSWALFTSSRSVNWFIQEACFFLYWSRMHRVAGSNRPFSLLLVSFFYTVACVFFLL